MTADVRTIEETVHATIPNLPGDYQGYVDRVVAALSEREQTIMTNLRNLAEDAGVGRNDVERAMRQAGLSGSGLRSVAAPSMTEDRAALLAQLDAMQQQIGELREKWVQ